MGENGYPEIVVGLCGTIGSGKGTVYDYLEALGFSGVTYSDIIREEIIARGFKVTRDNYRIIGGMLREEFGAQILSELILKKATEKKFKWLCCDGYRNPAEAQILRSHPNHLLIGIDAPVELRFERIHARKKEGDPMNFEQFKKDDDINNDESNPKGLHVTMCLEDADVLIQNDKTIEEFLDEVRGALENKFGNIFGNKSKN